MKKLDFIKNQIQPLADYQLQSRVHALKKHENIYIKRDDELSFSISGSKIRKYASLIPELRDDGIKEVLLIGGAYSNNILGLTQLLIESDIQPTLFLLENKANNLTGNYLFLKLFVSQEQIHWIKKEDWKQVEELVQGYAMQQSHKTKIIPEGACMLEALPGAMTLALDILRNEVCLNQVFDHIWLDSGTGLTAISTILSFSFLEKNRKFHILLLADSEKIFLEKLKKYQFIFEEKFNCSLAWQDIKNSIHFYDPLHSKSFGSTNRKVFKMISDVANQEGFLLDPVYSAKLYELATEYIPSNSILGTHLIIHSGGGLSLMGFQDRLINVSLV